jgi:uncharacterized protein (DUF1330 family)
MSQRETERKELMAAYFIVDVKVENPELYEEYRKGVARTLQLYGGTFLVRGGKCETIEGDWLPQRFVIVEFKNAEQFQRWYHSPEYSEIRKIRFQASTSRAILVQGV